MRGYPKSVKEVLRDDIEYPPKVIQSMKAFRALHVWKGTVDERFEKLKRLSRALAHVYGIEVPTLLMERIDGSFSGRSSYNPHRHENTMRGKLSVISFLHEFGHALGMDEYGATEWSANLFRMIFPKSFGRLVAHRHCLVKPDSEVLQEKKSQKNLKEEKKTSYICPHCKEKQTSIVMWQTASESWEYNLETREGECTGSEGGDFESWNCPGCGEEVPHSLTEGLNLP